MDVVVDVEVVVDEVVEGDNKNGKEFSPNPLVGLFGDSGSTLRAVSFGFANKNELDPPVNLLLGCSKRLGWLFINGRLSDCPPAICLREPAEAASISLVKGKIELVSCKIEGFAPIETFNQDGTISLSMVFTTPLPVVPTNFIEVIWLSSR